MIQYKVTLKESPPLVLSEAQFKILGNYIAKGSLTGILTFLVINENIPLLQLNLIAYIQKEEIVDIKSGVIKPPTPTELRAEKEHEEQNRDVTLDAQLAQAGEIPQK